MKKLMALCLAMLMALSMVSFSVMAEETEAPALAVTFEDIANGQPTKFVTSNLVLGENDVITSSDVAVIALDGTVTRPIYEDATVTLTINGGEAVDVTVKAKKTNVLYSNNFSTGVGDEWSLAAPAGNTPSSVGNGVLNVIIGATTTARTWNYYYPRAVSGTRPVVIQFDMSNITGLASAGSDIRISGNRYDAAGNKIGSFNTITVARCNNTSGFGGYWFGSAKKTVTLKYNPATGELWGNGTNAEVSKAGRNLMTCTETNFAYNAGKSAEDCAKVVITSIGITNAAGGCTATFDMDNFVQYEEVSDEDAFATATPAEKLAHYVSLLDEDYVANGGNLKALTNNLKFTSDVALPEGASLVWTSTNPAIAADGTVKRDVLEAQTATITGTLTIDGESISKSYDVKILPLVLAGEAETVDFDSYALSNGAAIATTGWNGPASNVTFTNVVDGDNSYATVDILSTEVYSENILGYTFQNAPQATGRYYVLEYDYRTNTAITGGVTGLAFKINGVESAKIQNRAGSYGLHPYKYRSGDFWYGDSNGTVKITANDFVTLKTVIDTQENTISYYADGVLKYSEPRYGSADLSNITSVKLQLNSRSAAGSFSIDNIKLYSENNLEDVLPTLDAADKVAYFKGLVASTNLGTATTVGSVLALDQSYASMNPASCGVAINWASDNTEYIANDGTVNKLGAHGAAVSVNMTATITAGDASDTVTVAVPVANETALMKSTDYSDTSIAIKNADYVTDEDSAHGSVLHMQNPTVGTHKSTDTIQTPTGGGRGDRFIFSADVKYENGSRESYGGLGLKTYAGAFGIGVYLNYGTNKVSVITTEAVANGAATGADVVSVTKYYQIPASVLKKGEGAWVNIMIDHNALSQTYNVYVDGILINDIPLLQTSMDLGSNGGSAIRGYSVELSSAGEIWVDNVELYGYSDSTAEEVNAAFNAALVDYASTFVHPVLTNCELPAMTIGRSWINGSAYNRDLADGKIKPTNVSTYKYVTDGPAITWTVDGKPATAINVKSPQTVEITVTASKDGISESKTFKRNVAPVAIRDLALGTGNCLNGAWIEGASGDEKLIVATYLKNNIVSVSLVDFTETEAWDAKTGKGDRYHEANGFVNNLGKANPVNTPDYDQIKIFVVDSDGITPLTYANTELKG